MLALARDGAVEGWWLRAERQVAGRGRQGRTWASVVGNFHGSTLVRLRPGDPTAATLGFVAAVALAEVVGLLVPQQARDRSRSTSAGNLHSGLREPGLPADSGLVLKWPNDLLLDGAKLSGILLERADDAVIVGVGVNLVHHPDLPDRPVTSLAAHHVMIGAEPFAEMLAERFGRWLQRWRGEGFGPVRTRWLQLAHPIGAALRAHLPDGSLIEGLFGQLDADGALVLALAGGERRVIHAGDVFLV